MKRRSKLHPDKKTLRRVTVRSGFCLPGRSGCKDPGLKKTCSFLARIAWKSEQAL